MKKKEFFSGRRDENFQYSLQENKAEHESLATLLLNGDSLGLKTLASYFLLDHRLYLESLFYGALRNKPLWISVDSLCDDSIIRRIRLKLENMEDNLDSLDPSDACFMVAYFMRGNGSPLAAKSVKKAVVKAFMKDTKSLRGPSAEGSRKKKNKVSSTTTPYRKKGIRLVSVDGEAV